MHRRVFLAATGLDGHKNLKKPAIAKEKEMHLTVSLSI